MGSRWGIDEGPVFYTLSSEGSDDISDDSELEAVSRAFHKWSCISKSGLRLYDSEIEGPKLIDLNDEINTVFWSETQDEARANGMGPGTLGITVGDVPLDGEWDTKRTNADITFNGFDHIWSVNGDQTDVESIALHEIGHFIGFDHPCTNEQEVDCLSEEESVLSPFYSGGLLQTLGVDDILAAQSTYEAQNEATCEGPYGLYEPCFDNCSCIDGLYCVPVTDVARCLPTCSQSQTACPESFRCSLSVPNPTTGLSPGYCEKIQNNEGFKPGTICENGRECASGTCLTHSLIKRSICLQSCQSTQECSDEFFCYEGACLRKNGELGIPCPKDEEDKGCHCQETKNFNSDVLVFLWTILFLRKKRKIGFDA